MRRVVFLATAILTSIALTPSLSRANGGATFDFGEEPYLISGEEIHASTVVWLGKKDVRALEEGPYYAYLVPDGKWIKPPRIPAGAIRVGALDFQLISEKKAAATISFVAPDLPSDRYGLPYCNDPCTRASIGDLYSASVLVARDAEAGDLLVALEGAEADASSFEWRFKRAKRQIGRLEEPAEDAQAAAADLQARVAELQAELRTAGNGEEGGVDLAPILAAAAAGLVAGVVLRRRRRFAPRPSPVEEAQRILEVGPLSRLIGLDDL